MSRPQVEHQERDEIGGSPCPPKGEYDTEVLRFEPDGDYNGTRIIKPVLGILNGDFEEKLIVPSFFINVGDTRSEEKMAKFLNKLGLEDALVVALPNSNSWIDDDSIEWIKLNAINKFVRVDTYVKKSKPNAEGKVFENSEVIAFMKVGVNGTVASTAGALASAGIAIDD